MKNHLFCLFVQTVYQNQTKPNLLNNKFNIKGLKSKVPEKLARAAQLLYRSVLVLVINTHLSLRDLLECVTAAWPRTGWGGR